MLAGLALAGISGDNHHVPNGRHIAYGASRMALGAVAALSGASLSLLMGWSRAGVGFGTATWWGRRPVSAIPVKRFAHQLAANAPGESPSRALQANRRHYPL